MTRWKRGHVRKSEGRKSKMVFSKIVSGLQGASGEEEKYSTFLALLVINV